jgi:hypothetical protein
MVELMKLVPFIHRSNNRNYHPCPSEPDVNDQQTTIADVKTAIQKAPST